MPLLRPETSACEEGTAFTAPGAQGRNLRREASPDGLSLSFRCHATERAGGSIPEFRYHWHRSQGSGCTAAALNS